MNNKVEFAAPAHILLMKVEAENSTRQENKNCSASIQASLQAARKKCFTKLDILALVGTWTDNTTPARAKRETNDGDQELLSSDITKTSRSIGPPAAWNRLTYD
jgi:hypothetical protein